MHPNSDAGLTRPNHCDGHQYYGRLFHWVLCLSCLLAGAALVTMAEPRNWLSAGASGRSGGGDTMLLDFTATWCGPCREMSPIVDRLAQQGYPIRKVDVDQQRQIAEHYNITSMPTFVLVVNGREVMRQSGVTSEAQLRRMLLQIPAWQEELASRDARNAPPVKPLATTPAEPRGEEFGPSPFSIDLGTAQAPPPRHFSNPARQGPAPRQNAGTAADRFAAVEPPTRPVVRAQSNEARARLPEASNGDPMLATTRLRVKDQDGVNFGTGTILESRVGRTVILTCGHIFRNLSDNGLVEVDVFGRGSKPITYVGKVIRFDEASDVGLVAIPTTERLPTISLASLNAALQVGDSVVSIGCGGGENPTREDVEVTSINKYTGPDNIECTGFPVPGRSGGGLFHGKELAGVCIAADPKDRRGVYTGLTPIYELLEQSGFGHLLPIGRPAIAAPAVTATESPPETPVDSPFDTATAELAQEFPATSSADMLAAEALAIADSPRGSSGSTAGSQSGSELQHVLNEAPDSEVICIVRPKNPGIPSRVVIIHEASPKLVGYLLDSPAKSKKTSEATVDSISRTDSLIPTTAEARNFEWNLPGERMPRTMSEATGSPTRPSSPRSFFED